MEYPVCLEGTRVGTLYVCPTAEDAELRAVCRTAPGLYRLYLRGNVGEVLLGITEDGCLRRRFSRELLSPAGEMLRGELRSCTAESTNRPNLLARLPAEARLTARGRCTEAAVPWQENSPFPLPELFCFARVGRDAVCYLFDGEGRPLMPKI